VIVTAGSHWDGSFFEGTGTLSTTTTKTVEAAPYTFASRFEGAPGAIPEELLAVGHAGCYNHALANVARKRGVAVESIDTSVELTMGKDDRGYVVDGIHIVVSAALPGVTEETFLEIAEGARVGCAISRALRVPITLDATLVSA
jgi:osmotically inducible protein OsmC